MKCPQCKLVEMLVKSVNEKENEVEYICKRCGTTVKDEIPQKEN